MFIKRKTIAKNFNYKYLACFWFACDLFVIKFRFLRKIVSDEHSSDEKQQSQQSKESQNVTNESDARKKTGNEKIPELERMKQKEDEREEQQAESRNIPNTEASNNNSLDEEKMELKQSSIQLRTLIAPDPLIPIDFVRFNDFGTKFLYCNQMGKIAVYSCNSNGNSNISSYFIPQLMQTIYIDSNINVVGIEWDCLRSNEETILVALSSHEIYVYNASNVSNNINNSNNSKSQTDEYQSKISFAKNNCKEIDCLAVSKSSTHAQCEHNFVVSCSNEKGESALYLFGYLSSGNSTGSNASKSSSKKGKNLNKDDKNNTKNSKNITKYGLQFESDLKKYKITAMTFNHNGNILITGSNDGFIRIFNVTTKFPELNNWEAHNKAIISLHLCNDANSVLSFSNDYCVRHWTLMPKNVCKKKWVLKTDLNDSDSKSKKDTSLANKMDDMDKNGMLCLALGPENYFAVSTAKNNNGKYAAMLYNVCLCVYLVLIIHFFCLSFKLLFVCLFRLIIRTQMILLLGHIQVL